MNAPGCAMANLLGDLWEEGEPNFAGMFTECPMAKLHLYGKREARPGRKMGHVNVTGPTVEWAWAEALAAHVSLAG